MADFIALVAASHRANCPLVIHIAHSAHGCGHMECHMQFHSRNAESRSFNQHRPHSSALRSAHQQRALVRRSFCTTNVMNVIRTLSICSTTKSIFHVSKSTNPLANNSQCSTSQKYDYLPCTVALHSPALCCSCAAGPMLPIIATGRRTDGRTGGRPRP